jgi:hypothetical protein
LRLKTKNAYGIGQDACTPRIFITMLLRVRSFAKINLGLSVLGRRTDGYHEIRTIFQTISLCDELEIRPSNQLELSCENLPDTPNEENLIWKAAAALAAKTAEKRGASITIRKKIPMGAGLGGAMPQQRFLAFAVSGISVRQNPTCLP